MSSTFGIRKSVRWREVSAYEWLKMQCLYVAEIVTKYPHAGDTGLQDVSVIQLYSLKKVLGFVDEHVNTAVF